MEVLGGLGQRGYVAMAVVDWRTDGALTGGSLHDPLPDVITTLSYTCTHNITYGKVQNTFTLLNALKGQSNQK